jgi:hypothetical protein
MYTPREQYRVKTDRARDGRDVPRDQPAHRRGGDDLPPPSKPASRCGWWMTSCCRTSPPPPRRSSRRLEADADARSPVEVVAAALAAISGHTEPPPPRSMLTGDVGLTTLVARADLLLPRDLLRAMSDVSRAAADGVGRIRVLAGNDGLCFDIAHEQVKPLLAAVAEGALDGIDIEVATTLPEMVEERERGGLRRARRRARRARARARARRRARLPRRRRRSLRAPLRRRVRARRWRQRRLRPRRRRKRRLRPRRRWPRRRRVFRQAPELRRPRRVRRRRRRPLVRGERRRRRRLEVRRVLGLTPPREPMTHSYFVTRAHSAGPREARLSVRAGGAAL